MPLTLQQQKFLDSYIRDHTSKGKISSKGKGKQKRADGFSAVRQQVMEALSRVPSGLPERAALLQQMAEADLLGDELKFDRAAAAMKKVLTALKQAVANYKPPVDPSQSKPGDLNKRQVLVTKLSLIVKDTSKAQDWTTLTTTSKLGGDLKLLATLAGSKLKNPAPTVGELAEADRLVDELTIKRDFVVRRNAEIDKRRRQLKKYALALQTDSQSYRNVTEEQLAKQANLLADKDAASWTAEDETRATSLYLDMMLAIGSRDGVQQKNFKEGSEGGEIVLAVRPKDGGSFKVVVKPLEKEIPVEGFRKGGGASREMMGGVVGDKLQEMLGLELDVPVTKLVKVDGGQIGMTPGTEVTASVQAFVKNGTSPKTEGEEAYEKKHGTKPPFRSDLNQAAAQVVEERCGKQEIQSKAIFDLIALHADRHIDNFLIGDDDKLVPIDHGNIMPTREGLRKRAMNMGPGDCVLALTATAEEKLDEDMVGRIERLNIEELLTTMKAARKQMVKDTPDADVGDLDEGFDNVRRSAEFLKFAARHLTLKQIYSAYEMCQDEIFFSDEQEKLQGFQRVIDIFTRDATESQKLEVAYQTNTVKGRDELLKVLRNAGWFSYTRKSTFYEFVFKYPARCLDMADGRLTHPVMPVPPTLPNKPEDVDDADWRLYWGLGGDDACKRRGISLDDECQDRIGMLEYVVAIEGRLP